MEEKRTQAEWDAYWLGMAEYASRASKDPSTKCAAIIVRPDNSVASIGYNGFPRRMRDTVDRYLDRGGKLSRVIHAEMNALLAAKESVEGCTIYVWPFIPCDRCAVHIIQANIVRVVAPKAPEHSSFRWAFSIAQSKEYFAESFVAYVEVEPQST